MFDDNIIELTDSYKVSHYLQYPEDTQVVYSYFESRGGQHPATGFFGLQYYLKKYLEDWLEVYSKIPITQEDHNFKKNFYLMMLERTTGSILADLAINDRFAPGGKDEEYKDHLIDLNLDLFEYLIDRLSGRLK